MTKERFQLPQASQNQKTFWLYGRILFGINTQDLRECKSQ